MKTSRTTLFGCPCDFFLHFQSIFSVSLYEVGCFSFLRRTNSHYYIDTSKIACIFIYEVFVYSFLNSETSKHDVAFKLATEMDELDQITLECCS